MYDEDINAHPYLLSSPYQVIDSILNTCQLQTSQAMDWLVKLSTRILRIEPIIFANNQKT
jgi:anaerobic C4-dicarboxylate transporter